MCRFLQALEMCDIRQVARVTDRLLQRDQVVDARDDDRDVARQEDDGATAQACVIEGGCLFHFIDGAGWA